MRQLRRRAEPSPEGKDDRRRGLTGTVLGERYRLGEEMGSGETAAVYRTRDLQTGSFVAVRVYRADGEAASARFRSEFQFKTGLPAHPNIASVYDGGEEDGLTYLVQEMVEGASLAGLLRFGGGPLGAGSTTSAFTLDRSLFIAGEIASGLTFAHRHGFVHGMLRPGKVLISSGGEVKLIGFGSASEMARSAEDPDGLLEKGRYLSPEQARGRLPSQASDIYSLGAIIFHMLTGEPPFSAGSPIPVLMGHLEGRPPAPAQLTPAIPSQVDRAVVKALSKSPKDRFETAEGFAAALFGRGTSLTGKPQATSTGSRRFSGVGLLRRVAMAFILVVGIGVVAGAGWAAYRGVGSLFGSSTPPAAASGGNTGRGRHGGGGAKKHISWVPLPASGQVQPRPVTLAGGNVHVVRLDVNKRVVKTRARLRIRFVVRDGGRGSKRRFGLRAALLAGIGHPPISDGMDYRVIRAHQGLRGYTRFFHIPQSSAPGEYRLAVRVDSPRLKKPFAVYRTAPVIQIVAR